MNVLDALKSGKLTVRTTAKLIGGTKLTGDSSLLWGDATWLRGNCTWLSGDCSGLSGDCSWLRGDCSKLIGNCTGLSGDCSEIVSALKKGLDAAHGKRGKGEL